MATLSANQQPERKLSQLFKGRRKRKDETGHSSSVSVASNGSTGDGSGGDNKRSTNGDATLNSLDPTTGDVKRRGSVRRAVHKLAHRNSVDDEDAKSVRRTSAIFLNDSFDLSQGDTSAAVRNRNESEDSLHLHKSVASSLLTDASDTEEQPIRPSLTPRHSHQDYLTLSSPLIASETIDAPTILNPTTVASATAVNLAPTQAKTLDVRSSSRRSPSPASKLRDAFTPGRRSTTPSDNSSEQSVGTGGGGRGIGSFFNGKKGSVHRGSKASEEPPSRSTDDLPISEESAKVKSFRGRRGSNGLEKISTAPATPPQTLHIPPETLVTPPTPTEPRPGTAPEAPPGAFASAIGAPSTGSMLANRRGRSGTIPPSKLSTSITPLTPFDEEAKTPGGTVTIPPTSGGFFSSVFSAAQNAANSISTIANSGLPNNKANKGGNPTASAEQERKVGGEEVIIGNPENESEELGTEKRQLAIETLGSGNLSLSHLGITDSPERITMAGKTDSRETASQNDNASAQAEDSAAAQAVSAAYAADKASVVEAEAAPRPRSINSNAGIQTPPRTQSTGPDIGRSGSVRSKFSGSRRRRHRGSSATTGNAIAAAVGASTATLANPMANSQRLTGFAVASPKRNRDFHQLFRSVPEDDYLIEDYSAALQRDILLHGRLYVSEGHICFSSNILGWVTNLVIAFDEVVTVEKKSTAVIFPNAIVIQTLHARNVFASFVTRDSTYDLLIGIWKINHPNLKSSLNGVTLDTGTGDKTEKTESITGTDDGSQEGSDDDVYDEDAEEEEGLGIYTEAHEGSTGESEGVPEQVISRKTSAAVTTAPVLANGSAKVIDHIEMAGNGVAVGSDFPGPATHAATTCGDEATHYETLLIDATIPAPLGKVYSMMFGPASGTWMRKFLVDDQKSRELTMEDDKKGLGEDRKTFNYSFIKPLNAPIGPKQTKCIINQTLEQFDLEKGVTVDSSTQNPDVPSGNIFLVRTKYCLMWGPSNSTRMIMTCFIEWSGKSWLKGTIERATNDGQGQYAKELVAALKLAVASKAPLKAPGPKGKVKGRKRVAADPDANAAAAEVAAATTSSPPPGNWGFFEPLHTVVGPIFDIVKMVAGSPVTVVILSLLCAWMYLRQSTPHSLGAHPGATTPHRLAAYEEIWRREESELWSWLEQRVSLDRALRPSTSSDNGNEWATKQAIADSQRRVVDEDMSERQIDEAIRTTQERLDVLRKAVERKKEGKGEKEGKRKWRTEKNPPMRTRPTEDAKVHVEL